MTTVDVDVQVKRFEHRRKFNGLLLGLLAGCVFGAMSQGVNYLVVRGAVLYQPPFGPFGNLALWALVGAALGLVTAWSDSSVLGVIYGSLLAGVLLQLSAFLSGGFNVSLARRLIGFIGLYASSAALVAPLLGLVRAAVNDQREWYDLPWFAWRRQRMTMILALASGLMGLLWLFPAGGQEFVNQMNQMVRAGLQAGNPAALPMALKDPLVGSFVDHASPDFTLELDNQNLNRYMIPYSPRGQIEPSAVIARFSNGWTLTCLYISPNEDPFCRGYEDFVKELSIGQDDPAILDDHGFIIKQK